MRDFLVVGFVFGSLPFILRKPFYGVLVWTLLGLLNPHRLCWDFAPSMPLAQIVAVALLAALLLSKEEKRLPNHYLVVLLAGFWFWMSLSTVFAFAPDGAWRQWEKVSKIMLMTFVTILLLKDKVRVCSLAAVVLLSFGFYGVKGGIFTLTTGGNFHVFGPPGSFIGDNNAMALALIMTIPIFRFFQLQAKSEWIRKALFIALMLLVISVFGSQSRGAFLGLGSMILFFVMKGRRKGPILFSMVALVALMLVFMPESYMIRMQSISEFEQDGSAMGRIEAWITTWRVVMDYPIFGGGFDMLVPWGFPIYAPEFGARDVHSIYFEVLGEHGFVGFMLFLGIGFGSFFTAGRVARRAAVDERLLWIRDLSSMLQVSIVGYAVTGAFLGLAYFDFFYVLVAIIIGLDVLLRRYEKEGVPESELGTLFQVGGAMEAENRVGLKKRNRMPLRRRASLPQRKGVNLSDSIKAWYSSL